MINSTIPVWTWVRSPLLSSNLNSLLLQWHFHRCHCCPIVRSLIWGWGCLLNRTQKHTCFMQTMHSQLMLAPSVSRLYSSSPAVAWPSGLGKLNLLENHVWKFETLVQEVLRHTLSNTKLWDTWSKTVFPRFWDQVKNLWQDRNFGILRLSTWMAFGCSNAKISCSLQSWPFIVIHYIFTIIMYRIRENLFGIIFSQATCFECL